MACLTLVWWCTFFKDLGTGFVYMFGPGCVVLRLGVGAPCFALGDRGVWPPGVCRLMCTGCCGPLMVSGRWMCTRLVYPACGSVWPGCPNCGSPGLVCFGLWLGVPPPWWWFTPGSDSPGVFGEFFYLGLPILLPPGALCVYTPLSGAERLSGIALSRGR